MLRPLSISSIDDIYLILITKACPNCFMASWSRWSSSRAMSLSLSSLGRKVVSLGMSKSGSHKLFSLELSASHSWMTITSWGGAWPCEWAMSWCEARPSEWECSVGGIVVFLFLLKTSLKVVSSSCLVGVWVIKAGAFLFYFKDSLSMLVATLIFLVSSASSALLMLDNVLSAKKTSKWLIAIAKLFSPRVGNEEYQCKLSEHQECTLWSTSRRCQKQLSSSLGTRRFLDLLSTYPPGIEHSGI